MKVWYCIELNELTLWKIGSKLRRAFKAEHVPTGKVVTMIYVGEL